VFHGLFAMFPVKKSDMELCWKSRQWDEKLQKVILCMG